MNQMLQAECLTFIHFFNACVVFVSYVKLCFSSSRFQVVSPNVVCNRKHKPDWWSSINVAHGILQVKGGCGGIQILFPIFVPPTQNPKISKKGKTKGSLWSKLQSAEAECWKGNLCLEKAKCFSFRSRDWKDPESCTKSFQQENFQKLSRTSPIVQPCAGKTLTEFDSLHLSCEYIYIYLLYSLHICCFYSYRGDSLTYVLDL